MELADLFGKFQLDQVDSFWVDSVWEKDFCEEKELPSDYELVLEELNILDLIKTVSSTIKDWITDPIDQSNSITDSSVASNARRSWQSLVSKNLGHRAFIALISTFIKKDIKEFRSLDEVYLALEACRCYFVILSVHGAHVFNIFNSILFGQAIDTLKILKVAFTEKNIQKEKKRNKTKNNLQDNENELENEDEEDGATREKGKGKKKKGQQTSDLENSDENDKIELNFSGSQKIHLLDRVAAFLDDLRFCLQNLELKCEKDSILLTIQNLVSVVSLEKTSYIFQVRPHPKSLAFLAFKSIEILGEMCNQSFGNVEDIVRFIMRSVLPHLCPNEQDFLTNANASRGLSILRENLLNFIYRLVSAVKEASYDGVIAAVQQLCVRTPDKADVRAKCVQVIVSLLEHLPTFIFNHINVWLLSLCHAESVRNRVVGVEIIATLLLSAHHHPNLYQSFSDSRTIRSSSISSDHIPPCSNDNSSPRHRISSPLRSSTSTTEVSRFSSSLLHLYISVVVSKCADISPTVRTKALSTLASVVLIKQEPLEDIILKTFIDPYMGIEVIDKLDTNERKFFNFKTLFKSWNPRDVNSDSLFNLKTNPIPGGTFIMDLVEKLSHDDKVFVKKAALSVVCNICLLAGKWNTERRIELMIQACKDISLVVRKQMTSCLTDLLLAQPTNELLVAAWVDGVFPLIGDNEIKSQEKVLETATKLIIDNMEFYDSSTTGYSQLPWKIVAQICNKRKRKLFRIVCRYWSSVNKIRSTELKILRSHIGTENNLGALFLLVSISEFQNIPKNDHLLRDYYAKVRDCTNISEFESQLILEAIFLNLSEINEESKTNLCASIKETVNKFAVPLPIISRCMDIYQHTYPAEIKTWTDKLVKDAELHLNRTINGDCKEDLNQTVLCQYIYTLGEASMTSPNVVSEELVSSLVALVDFYDERNDLALKWKDKLTSQTHSVIVVTLGKLCLQDQLLAKSIVPVLGALLDNRSASEIKINTLVALTDLCVRFTSLVEAYLGDMCVCLKDKDLAVRKMTLTLLMQLITEDYIKLRGPYFFYLLCMLEDPSEEIKEQTSSFLINCARTKQGNIMATFFIQAIYFFNDYEGEKQYSRVEQGPQEREAFCISGRHNREIRRRLYRFMLEHMQDDHRFKITHKLSTDILCEVSQNVIPLEGNGSLLLEDALFCLACEEIRLVHMNQTKDLADDGSGELNRDEIIGNICKRTIISQALKKDYVDVVVPIILNLKSKLIELKSPLVHDLRIALRELMKDFKEEINEILINDNDTAAEIALELRKIEQEEQARLSPSTCRQHEQQVVMLQNLYVHCEKLSQQVLKDFGYDTPEILDSRENRQEDGVVDVPNGSGTAKKQLEQTRPDRSSAVPFNQNSFSTYCSESGTQSILNGDGTSTIKESPKKKARSSISSTLSQNDLERGSLRRSQSSLSTAFGETSQSMLQNGTRDGSSVVNSRALRGLSKKRRNASEESNGEDEIRIRTTKGRSIVSSDSSSVLSETNSSSSPCDEPPPRSSGQASRSAGKEGKKKQKKKK
ncbi:chromosome associated protein D3 isoform X2 [Rhodnius prolixus]|uniref:chromosome associated protein D3 isoform X2 n=1 Tax=Rhodnius prolixus TaxID=13249 RepID=UPI003D18B008